MAVLLILQEILVRLAADRNVAAAILSGGPHTPTGALLLAGAVVLVRAAAVFAIPGLLLRAAGLTILDLLASRKKEGPAAR